MKKTVLLALAAGCFLSAPAAAAEIAGLNSKTPEIARSSVRVYYGNRPYRYHRSPRRYYRYRVRHGDRYYYYYHPRHRHYRHHYYDPYYYNRGGGVRVQFRL